MIWTSYPELQMTIVGFEDLTNFLKDYWVLSWEAVRGPNTGSNSGGGRIQKIIIVHSYLVISVMELYPTRIF